MCALVTDPRDAPVCVHGTYKKVLPLILQNGLSTMGRNHIHFAPGLGETTSTPQQLDSQGGLRDWLCLQRPKTVA